MITTRIEEAAAAAAAGADLGEASARKTGRDPRWPYVPVVIHVEPGTGFRRQSQIRAKAFATRDEAVAHAEAVIAANRARLERNLLNPAFRALREQYGLPREMA